MGHLYKITDPLGKLYIGITKRSIQKRWYEHVYSACKENSRTYLHNAIRKHGAQNFKIESLAAYDDWQMLCNAERIAIVELQTAWPTGYNLTKGGDGFTGTHSEESNRKRSESLKRAYANGTRKVRTWKPTAEQIETHASKLRGVKKPPRTAEHSAKISAAKRGIKASGVQLESLKKGWLLAKTEWKGEEMKRRAMVRHTKGVSNGN